MDMKITASQVAAANRYTGITKKAPVSSSSPVSRPTDKLDVSASDRLFADALAAAKAAPEVREDRVNAVRTAVTNGTYTVNSRAIADKILGSK